MGPLKSQQIEAQLERILASPAFASSERMCRFLRHAVLRTLQGRTAELKESLLGVEVFDRSADYDARIDPIVRVEARRLRAKLTKYYESAGRADELVIELPRGGYAPTFQARGAQPEAEPGEKTIAVLPFANLSAEPENQYFSDGLTRELIHELTRVAGLRVVAWNSVSQLREKAGKPREVGELLKVDVVLEGGVQRFGNKIRITAQLMEAATGVYLWSESYQRELEDLFALQEEMARTLALLLKVRLVHRNSRHCNVAAYNFYLQGRHIWNSRTEIGLRQSIALFERALQEDAGCAAAYAGIADAYNLLCDFGFLPSDEGAPLARQAACRALEIDPSLGEAHNSLAFLTCFHDWDWRKGEAYYLRALELNPGYATAHHWYGTDFLALRGRFADATREMAIARILDPLDIALEDSENYLLLLQRQYGEAEQRYQRLARRAPDFPKAYSGLGRVLALQGRYADAIAMLEKARAVSGNIPSLLGALGQIHAMNGNAVKARRLLKALEETARHRYVSSTCFLVVHLGLGEKSAALDWLERGLDRRDLALAALKVHPAYDGLRDEPRFQRALERMGLAD